MLAFFFKKESVDGNTKSQGQRACVCTMGNWEDIVVLTVEGLERREQGVHLEQIILYNV